MAFSIAPAFDHFVSSAFEEICQDWALFNIPETVECGRWWGSKRVRTPEGLRNRQYEADVVCVDASSNVTALGSCKWSSSKHDACELDKLETITKMLDLKDPPLYFFDRTGFSDRLVEIAKERSNVHLILASKMRG